MPGNTYTEEVGSALAICGCCGEEHTVTLEKIVVEGEVQDWDVGHKLCDCESIVKVKVNPDDAVEGCVKVETLMTPDVDKDKINLEGISRAVSDLEDDLDMTDSDRVQETAEDVAGLRD